MTLDHAPDAPHRQLAGHLTVERSNGPAGPRLVIAGELDASTVPVLAGALRQAARTELPELVVDVRGLTFCDAAGLKLLTEVAGRLTSANRRLVVHGPCPSLQLLLGILGPAAPFEVTVAPLP